jgi:hypothetical protein
MAATPDPSKLKQQAAELAKKAEAYSKKLEAVDAALDAAKESAKNMAKAYEKEGD